MLLYLKARIPFISLRTDERDRALDLLRQLAPQLNIPIYFHTLSQGTRDLATSRVMNDDRSVPGALDFASAIRWWSLPCAPCMNATMPPE